MSQTASTNVEELYSSLLDRYRFTHVQLIGACPYQIEEIQRLHGTSSVHFDLQFIIPRPCCLSNALESKEAKLLREIVSSDSSLRSVELEWNVYKCLSPCSPECNVETSDDVLAAGWRYILPAIAANRSIVRLRLPSPFWCGEDVFCDMLRETQSLEILEMFMYRDETDKLLQIADAFSVNVTLRYIALYADRCRHNFGQFTEAILKQLVDHPMLECLKLSCKHCSKMDAIPHTAALSTLLKTTTTMQTLVLSGYVFGTIAMEHLVAGLQSNCTVTKLVLENKRYNMTEESSDDVFMNFLGRSDLHCPLRILEYYGRVDRLGEAMFPASSRHETSPLSIKTIASQLEVLKLSVPTEQRRLRDISYGGFLDVLLNSANVSGSQLRELHIGRMDSSSCGALAAGLCELVHLRKFSLPIVVNGKFDWKRWLHAAHRSGRLHNIENKWHCPNTDLFHAIEARNKMLPVVLRKLCELHLQINDEKSVDAPTLAGDTSLVPTLLCVTRPMYRWGATYSLMCLLAINNSEMDIDPFRHHPKRLCVGMK